jgi:hypothetical protein
MDNIKKLYFRAPLFTVVNHNLSEAILTDRNHVEHFHSDPVIPVPIHSCAHHSWPCDDGIKILNKKEVLPTNFR